MSRPYVILNAAMTLDGKIATVKGDSGISCDADLDRLHKLRTEVDAVMVGVGTVLADDPSLTARRVRGKNPIRVVLDRRARTPPDARIMRGPARTIVAVSNMAPMSRVEKLRAAGAEILYGGGREVDLERLLSKLHSRGVRKVLLEGGSTLNWNMIKHGLVDEIRVTVSPRIVGGEKAKSLVGGAGFARVNEGARLKLFKVRLVGGDLLLTYRVLGARDAKKAR